MTRICEPNIMINYPLEEINSAVIEYLIQNGTPEDKTLEYKRDLPGRAADDKKEFLADVTSFANASGGDIIYGIEEERTEDGKKTGKPNSVYGLCGEEPDEAIRRLHNMIRDGIDPRLTPDVQLKTVPGFAQGKIVLVLRIRKSWSGPHMVKTRASRFYTRTSAGKYAMDTSEIRVAFAVSEELPRRIQNFRNERLARILSNEGPIPLRGDAKLIMHLVPISAMESPAQLDMEELMRKTESIYLVGQRGRSTRFNLDGWLIYTRVGLDEGGLAYIQFFRSGAIEALDASRVGPIEIRNPFYREGDPRSKASVKAVLGPSVGKFAIDTLDELMQYVAKVDVQTPAYLFLSVTGVKGTVLVESRNLEPDLVLHLEDYMIGGDILMLPEVQIDDLNASADRVIRPALDALWQAAGRSRCPNYDEEGNWKRR